MDAKPGDKVCLKSASHRGLRGTVDSVDGTSLIVLVTDTADHIRVDQSDVTNYSLAARKAWESMPDRRVGRPRGTTSTNRVSVTLRIDRELWDQFKHAEESGVITNRTETINAWIAEKLSEIG